MDPPGPRAPPTPRHPRASTPGARALSLRLRSSRRSAEPSAEVALPGFHLCIDRVPPPRCGAGVRRAVGAERIPRPIEVEAITPVCQRQEGDEAAGGIGAVAVGRVPEVNLQLRLVRLAGG